MKIKKTLYKEQEYFITDLNIEKVWNKGIWKITFNDVFIDFIKYISGRTTHVTILNKMKIIFSGHNIKNC